MTLFEESRAHLNFENVDIPKIPSIYKTFAVKHSLDLKNGKNLGSATLSVPTVTAMKKKEEKSSHWYRYNFTIRF
jgi:hypothetical protein